MCDLACNCVLCFSPIINHLVQSHGQFKVYEEILSLQFVVHVCLPYICKQCVGKLRKRRAHQNNLRQIEEELFDGYSSKAFKVGLSVKKRVQTLGEDGVEASASHEKQMHLDKSLSLSSLNSSPLITSTPVKSI